MICCWAIFVFCICLSLTFVANPCSRFQATTKFDGWSLELVMSECFLCFVLWYLFHENISADSYTERRYNGYTCGIWCSRGGSCIRTAKSKSSQLCSGSWVSRCQWMSIAFDLHTPTQPSDDKTDSNDEAPTYIMNGFNFNCKSFEFQINFIGWCKFLERFSNFEFQLDFGASLVHTSRRCE